MQIAFNSANLVGRVTGYCFDMSAWGEQHKLTVKSTDKAEFAKICGEIAETGFTAIELWQALAEAVSLYLSEPGHEVHVELEDAPGPEAVTERRVLLRSA